MNGPTAGTSIFYRFYSGLAGILCHSVPLTVQLNTNRSDPEGLEMGNLLVSDSFTYPNGLITNEYAARHPTESGVHLSEIWLATSGSLYALDGQAYSGVPDGGVGGATPHSEPENGSARLRVITRRADFTNCAVRFKATPIQFSSTRRTPPESWDGLHVPMRRQSAETSYYVDVLRRDGSLTIKRKRDDVYSLLAGPVTWSSPLGSMIAIEVQIETLVTQEVSIQLRLQGEDVLQAVDSAAERINDAGSTGIRGDNCEFTIDDFTVEAL